MPRRILTLAGLVLAISCRGSNPSGPSSLASDQFIDVLPYLVGQPDTWPRQGSQWQHQIVDATRQQVCWAKYGNPAMFECWRWDDDWIYHVIDHGLDGGRGGSYRFTDGRWLPRHLPRTGFSLDLPSNLIRRYDGSCLEQASPQSFPYRLRAWHESNIDAGGDLGVRDVVVLEYQAYHPGEITSGAAERFYLARGAGWYLWTRVDGVRVAFNRRGGPALPALETRCTW